ncbi:MAG TPA: AI-2E family transporter [Candidatus Limnocylindria bacterium]|nr:AI-2E family transporter [Candidatus Limnocylindria bacterium]
MTTDRSAGHVPRWLQRAGAFSWRIAVLFALGAVLTWLAFTLGTVTASVIVALIVAATFAPLGQALRRRGWSASASAAAVTGAAVVVAGALIVLLVVAFAPYLPGLVAAIEDGIAAVRTQVEASGSPELAEDVAQIAVGIQAWVTDNLAAIVGSVANAVTVALLALFLTFFLLQDGEKGWGRAIEVTDGWRRDRLNDAGRVALARVGGYLRGTAVLSGVVAGSNFVYLTVLGVPLAAPLAVLAFLGGFIPYIGGLIATGTILLVTWASVGLQAAIVMLVLIAVTRLIVSNVLRPVVYGSRVGLHPGIILIVLPAGAAVAGIVGVFAAVPITVFVASITASVIAALEPPVAAVGTDVPPWLDRLAQWGWRLLAVLAVAIGAIIVFGQLPLVVAPILLAAILAASVVPLVRALRRRGWGNQRSAMAVTGGSVLAILAIVIIAVAALGPGLADAIAGGIAGAEEVDEGTSGAMGWLAEASAEVGTNVVSAVAGILGAASSLLVVLLLAGLLTFYLLRDGRKGWEQILSPLDPWQRDELEATMDSSVAVLGGYMGGTAVISAVGAVSQLAIMVILGLPYAVPVAILSFFACFIPYVGGFITTGLAFLIAVAFGDPATIVIMGIYTVVFNIIQGNVVTPLVYRRAVHLHPAIILLAIPAGGAVAGILGMFLAVPILALFATVSQPLARLLAGEPAVSGGAVEGG